jgi:hypothetical protein
MSRLLILALTPILYGALIVCALVNIAMESLEA